jgi:hypothetical protein
VGSQVSCPDDKSVLAESLDVTLRANDEIKGNTDEGLLPAPLDGLSPSIAIASSETESNVISLDDEPLQDFFSDEWEAEEEVSAPEGDETVVELARLVHETIGHHKVVDHDEDWGDVDLHLPARAAPIARMMTVVLSETCFLKPYVREWLARVLSSISVRMPMAVVMKRPSVFSPLW